MATSGRDNHLMDTSNLAEAIAWQADHAEQSGAPCTARVIRALLPMMAGDTATGRRIANWQGAALADAMPLRIAGGFHYLALSGAEPRLNDVYAGLITDQGAIDALICDVAQRNDTALLPWLDGPPQTNEAGRSAAVMAALLWLSGKLGPNFELIELGASAGANTMLDRYSFDLGGTRAGAVNSLVTIKPDWRGDAPPANPVSIHSIRGCDLQTIDLADDADAMRLKSYVWPDAGERLHRMEGVITLAKERAPHLTECDAADFVERQLAIPQAEGVTRVLFHTVMWQYMPAATQQRITAAMEDAAHHVSQDAALAWIMLEPNPETFRMECRVRYWPDGACDALLAETHPHGAWVEWNGAD